MARGKALALTQGDPSGIGPELALMAWLRRTPDSAPFFAVGDPGHLGRLSGALQLAVPIVEATPENAAGLFADALPVVPSGPVAGVPGRPAAQDAAATISAIESAVGFVMEGRAAGIVTNPITKDNLYKAGFRHPGHTEFLAELAERHTGSACHSVMMLWCPELAVVPVTIHVSLAQAIHDLTSHLIVQTCAIAAHDLKYRFGIERPRLAVSGLNPHAGENGAMGSEDAAIIAPAVAELKARNIDAFGPLPADTMFHAAARARYDAAICMYHDQALIPVKTLAFDSAVNVTLGLPFVRTSPDHGTAYDIAGKGIARPDSLIAAISLADRLARRAMKAAA